MKKLIVVVFVAVGGYLAYRVWANSQRNVSVWDEVADSID
ncbi:MAG: DLW-39 family protein [Bifidobacteriaceae bacterium]|nr:DLW-39 family protein [Bifidobacteriaceae bacterium]